MLSIEPMGGHIGATIRGLDTSKPLGLPVIGEILQAIGTYGLLRFPDQKLDPAQHKALRAR